MSEIITETCRCCGKTKPISEFARNKNTKTGYYIYCRECKSDKYYDKMGKKRAGKIRYKVGVRDMRSEIIKALGGRCVRCGFEDERALQIDHVNGGGNHERKTMSQYALYKNMYELVISGNNMNKYQVLCANCNWIKRHENKEN